MPSLRGPIILASGSPRRLELLRAVGFEVKVVVPEVSEDWPPGTVEEGVMAIAERKLRAVDFGKQLAIAADTAVVLGTARLGKPRDKVSATQMLSELSGREHQVVTGFCVAKGGLIRRGHVCTKVSIRPLLPLEIERYVDTPEPYDKAGGYAVQGAAGIFIDKIEGSFTNVVGLPLSEVLAAVEFLK